MSLFSKIFRPREYIAKQYFKTLTAYQPTFRRWSGALYESEIVRSAIDARARHIAKLSIKIEGAAQPRLQTLLRKRPNQWQTWSQFIYRCSTILDMQNTLFIVPIIDRNNLVTGLWACLPTSCKILEDKQGTEWLEYKFSTGDVGAVELSRCGVMTRHQYRDDFFGESNRALDSTLDLIELERQGIAEGIRQASSFRFMARLTNFKDPEDLEQEQKNFTARNLSRDAGGFLLFPNTYSDIQQIDQKPYVVDHDQMELIQNNVFNYFGISKEVLQNSVVGDAWNAFYEGGIEPWAIQFSEVMTRMTYTAQEIARGNEVFATSNRMQYLNNADKLNVSAQLLDRGILNRDEARSIWNLPPLPNDEGKAYVIRGEYVNANDKINGEEPDDGGGSSADGDGTGESAGKGSAGPGPEVSAGSVPEVLGADGEKAGARRGCLDEWRK